MSEINSASLDPLRRARTWLQQQGALVTNLTPLSGYTNHVFLVEQSATAYPRKSVLRLANFSLAADLCPLAHQFDAVLRRHVAAAELGLAPEVMAAEHAAGAMWLQYAGERKPLEAGDYAELRGMLLGLYESELGWNVGGQVVLQDLLKELCKSEAPFASSLLTGSALQQAQQRGYFDYPLVPIHGDLNPGNLLHDGKRWWLIDWDFAGMQIREWDLAGLIVEHGWRVEQALAFAPDIELVDLKWFCSCFALLSWHWHQQRGSDQQVIVRKAETMHYWITLKG